MKKRTFVDSLEDKVVQLRITVPQPAKMTGDTLLSGRVSGSKVENRTAAFGKCFRNRLTIIQLDQEGDFGQPLELAARVNLDGFDTSKLYLYSYNQESNSYKHIQTDYRIDKNGYLYFILGELQKYHF